MRYKHNAKEVQGNDFWEAVKGHEVNNQPFFDQALVTRVELCRSIVLNPISHAAITNAFRREIEDSIKVIGELENELKKVERHMGPQG